MTTKSRAELVALRTWLKEHGHPPLRRVRNPVLSPLWAHDAAVLAEFDREFPTAAENGGNSPFVDSTPDDVHVLYHIAPDQSSYRSLEELPSLTLLELFREPKRPRKPRRG